MVGKEGHAEDLAHGLAHTYRYGGQSEPGITVAEHVDLVSKLAEVLFPQQRDLPAGGFMHDSVEAYLHDLQAPVRTRCEVTLDSGRKLPWEDNDARLIKIIGKQFGIDPELFDSIELLACDVMACSFEYRDCKNLEGSVRPPLPIPEEVQHFYLRFWNPEQAKRQFLFRADELGLPTS